MRPSKTSEIKEIDPNVFRFGEKEKNIKYLNKNNRSFAEVIENARVISLFVGFFFTFFYLLYLLQRWIRVRS